MSAVLNITAVALILPNLALAAFFLVVGFAAGQQTLGALLKSLWGMLPAIEYLPFIALGALAALATLIVAAIRFGFVLPALAVLLGGGSLLYVGVAAGWRASLTNPFELLCLVGVALGGWQLWRSVQSVPA